MAAPTAMPSAPPISDSTTLSVSSCRMMRRRPAPSAERTASSRVRAVARASSRFATLRAADQQHEPDDAEEQHRGRLQIAADHRVVQRLDGHRAALVELGILARQSLGHRGQIRLRRFDADARLHPANDLQLVGAPRARRHVGGNGRIAHMRCARESRSPSA